MVALWKSNALVFHYILLLERGYLRHIIQNGGSLKLENLPETIFQ
jgi:hypothetical protein